MFAYVSFRPLRFACSLLLTVGTVGLTSPASFAGPVPATRPATHPAWWFARDVIPLLPTANPASPSWPADYAPADDYALANLGQLKFVVTQAAAELNATLPPPGAGAAIHDLLAAWRAPSALRDDFATVNQGQLKSVAQLFYDRLALFAYTGAPLPPGQPYPWSDGTGDDDAYAAVNLGQLKHVFSFNPGLVDSNSPIRYCEACQEGFVPLPANDDGSTGSVAMGLSIKLGEEVYSNCYVNNNGNLTFAGALQEFTPNTLLSLGIPIIAAYWADVDTRGEASGIVRYGQCNVEGRSAFFANYFDVGYFYLNDDKLNVFQIVVVDRSDIASGDVDVEFNYEKILWETGDSSMSGGVNGYGGVSARVGINNGLNSGLEFPHSGDTLNLLDFDPITNIPNIASGLIYQARNSSIPGRVVYRIRGGVVQ